MTRKFSNDGTLASNAAWYYRAKWETEAYLPTDGIGSLSVVDFNFRERNNYGLIDNNNYAIYPKTDFLETLGNSGRPDRLPRVFDFVADAYSIMRMNIQAAYNKGMLDKKIEAFGDLTAIKAYRSPQLKYYDYMKKVLNSFNKSYLPLVGLNNITSYNDYVNQFLKLIELEGDNMPVTFTRFQKSRMSSILDTGLAFEYFEIPPNIDQTKIDRIIDQDSFDYFKNLCMNMGFSIPKNTPNKLVFDVSSPAVRPYLGRYGITNLDSLFSRRFDYTYINDINYMYNIINIYYNNFVLLNPTREIHETHCAFGKTVVTRFQRQPVNQSVTPFSTKKQLFQYVKIRNIEESRPFSDEKVEQIYKKSIYFNKKVDKNAALRYISSMFKDQVWNKDHGYDDYLRKLNGLRSKTQDSKKTSSNPTPNSSGGGAGY